MPLYIAKSGDLDRCYRCLTDRLTTLKDRATQLLIKYKSGALVTQIEAVRQSSRWGVPPSFESNNLPAARLWLEVGHQLHFCVCKMIIWITITGGQV